MDKEFIPYEESLVLKELGFDEPCYGYYGSHQVYFWIVKTPGHYDNDNNALPAPLYQQAFRWFREKYEYIPHVFMNSTSGRYSWKIDERYSYVDYTADIFNTYEEAELECLRKLIEITKK
jgi:hypothetical protein